MELNEFEKNFAQQKALTELGMKATELALEIYRLDPYIGELQAKVALMLSISSSKKIDAGLKALEKHNKPQ